MGTGDGRLPFALALSSPDRLFVGLDANAAGLREASGRAFRQRVVNLVYLRAALEELPGELGGIADHVSVILPWGSLLAAVARPDAAALAGLRGVCQPGATLSVVLGGDACRDRGELARLGLAPLEAAGLPERLRDGYAAAGFRLGDVHALPGRELAGWPSSWAKRLAHGGGRTFVELVARAE